MYPRFLALLAVALGASLANGESYPVKPIKVFHGFSPGGAPDSALRSIATALAVRLGQPIVVENRPGASGTIAATLVARAPADGYTLLFGVAANLAVAPATMVRPPYDPSTAFTPIVEVARGPYLWLVPSRSPARSISEFLTLARSNPGKLNFGSPGIGSVHHLATEALERSAGIRMTHVPYSTGGLYTGMLAGQVDGMFDSMPTPLAYIRDGKLRALGVTGSKRLAALPDVPTFAEQGIADPGANSWWGFVGPKGLSEAIVEKLNGAIAATLADPSVAATFERISVEPSPDSPKAFGEYITSQYHHWRNEARAHGVRLD
jgi:tripartite-type tricarboxylate transporter receptor subunit TctC